MSNGHVLGVEKKLKQLKEVHDIQGSNGNWDAGFYDLGLFNGLELALAIMEDREPILRMPPETHVATDIQQPTEGSGTDA